MMRNPEVEVGQVRVWLSPGDVVTGIDRRLIVWRNEHYCVTVEVRRSRLALPVTHDVRNVARWPLA